MRYEVFIERSRDASPGAMRELAAAVAARFGVPSEAIASRLAQGSFRVKGGVDLDKARRFAAVLESMGAECSIRDDFGRPVGTALDSKPAEADDGLLTLAAPSPAAPRDVVAADSSTTGGLRLAAVDGSEGSGAEEARAAVAASDVDAFLPPEMQNEQSIDFLTPPPEMIEPAPEQPPSEALPTAPEARTDALAPSIEPQHPAKRRDPLSALANDERLRIAVGAALAVLLGFAAAHLVASASEQGYAEIRAELREAHASADTEDRWYALDEIRMGALDRLNSKRIHVAITAMTLWAVVGGFVAFLWYRKIDWSRWATPPDDAIA